MNMMPGKHKWTLVLLLPVLLFLTGCALEYFVAANASGDESGIYRIKDDGSDPTFSAVPGINYLIKGPDEKLFYATLNKLPDTIGKEGGVVLLRKNSNDTFDIIRIAPNDSVGPCHLTLSPDGRFLYTANYGSGTISEMPVIYGIPRIAGLIYLAGQGKTKRQLSPHPHFVGFDPQHTALFVADLGTDRIYVYEWLPGRGVRRNPCDVLKLEPGAGPRHLVFSPEGNVLYVANELDSTVTSFKRNTVNGRWSSVVTRPTLKTPGDASKNFPGAILITPDGRFFFVTNRGDNSIALFETTGNGQFNLIQTVKCGGDYPSDMALTSDGTLLVANLKSGNVTYLQFDPEAKTLTLLPKVEKASRAARILLK